MVNYLPDPGFITFFQRIESGFLTKIYFNRTILLYFSENCFGKSKKPQKVIIGRTFFELTRRCSRNNSEFLCNLNYGSLFCNQNSFDADLGIRRRSKERIHMDEVAAALHQLHVHACNSATCLLHPA